MLSNTPGFPQYLPSAFTTGPWSTDEVVAFLLPLCGKLLDLHQQGLVAPFEKSDALVVVEDKLDINEQPAHPPVLNLPALERVPHAYLPTYRSFEIEAGHHDAQTDIFCLGLILGSMVMGLNLDEAKDLEKFMAYREQPAGLNPRMHPTICALVTEMTELDRSRRSRDLQDIMDRLKYYRDYDPFRETDLAAVETKKPADRRSFILSKLRNRLFDTSRRNRLLYYKPNSRFVNLTVSSVPLVQQYQTINPDLLFTWNKEIAKRLVDQDDILLNKYLRFEDHIYLGTHLNGVRLLAANDHKEYGFSQLKLVVSFLHWHNLKEEITEKIQSPLLLLPAELERKKSLREERFTLIITDNTALVNPILANQLKELYGIDLPETVDLEEVSMEQFFTQLQAKIDAAGQGVKLSYVVEPNIKNLHGIARQTILNYRKKLQLKNNATIQEPPTPNPSPASPAITGEVVAAGTVAQTDPVPDEAPNNPYSWHFDVCNMVLGNFNYKKMSLVSDYNRLREEGIEHAVFNQLFSSQPKETEDASPQNDPAEWYHVITADPTQTRAVLRARNGKSYIIQGPPGTGKSQTITNLVADCLAHGKTVLFVCEKRAALDVVYHRLEQNKLAELCSYIHDSQGDKKEFIKDLRTVYEDFVKNKMDLPDIATRREELLKRLLEKIDELQAYHRQQQSMHPDAGIATLRLIDTLVGLKTHLPQIDAKGREALPHYNQWLQYGGVIKQLGTALEEVGAPPQLAGHPFSNLGLPVIQADNPLTLMDSLVSNAHNAIQQMATLIAQNNIPPHHAELLDNIKNLVQDSVLLESLAQSGNLHLVNTANPEAKEFEQVYQQYSQLRELHKQALAANTKWLHKLERHDLDPTIQVAQKHERSFFRFFSSSWRRLKKQLKQHYDFSAHVVKPSVTAVLQQLQEEYKAQDNAAQSKQALEKKYGMDNIDTVYLSIEVLRRKQGDEEIDYLLQHPKSNELVLQLSRLNNVLHQLELQLKQCLYDYNGKTLQQVKNELDAIQANASLLKQLLPALRRFAELPAPLQQLIRELPVTPLQAQAAMANKTWQSILDQDRSFADANRQVLQQTVQAIEKLYENLLQVNSDYIRARRRQKFLANYELSNMAATVLTPEQKLLKKQYTDGRKILEHEMGKTMRYKSIREMASNESGKVLRDIKPVWLMSPLSVSDSLPLDDGYFDVVIFDEASQVTLEEGIPALFRAPQTIIVGDDKQMPPTNFFSAKGADPEDLETVEGEKEDEILSADADSLLVQGSRKLGSTMLSWHYRSRHETLISYSNHAFYEGGLLTIPDQTIHHNTKPLLEVSQPAESATTAAALLQGSISYHYLPNSVYESRTNTSEANYIAGMVKKLLMDGVQQSIGIVAFSQEQQGVIEGAIDSLAEADNAFEELLEKAYNRNDDGQFTGLFVKNLENVQGDERDIIIMSICYGHDRNKKMRMNFGPINRKGGERRLNVIFSRAKKHMAIVSSIRHFHITNDYNDGANYLKKFLHYTEMVSTGNMNMARTILDSLLVDGQKKKVQASSSATTLQVKAALEQKGYLVDEQIGQSSFKCTLGIKRKADDADYLLGILVDEEGHYSNNDIAEQYYQRPAILQAFGWQVTTVFAKDWLEDAEHVVKGILNLLETNGVPPDSIPA